MDGSRLLASLEKRRGRVAAAIEEREAELDALRCDLIHFDRVLALCRQELDPLSEIVARHPRKNRKFRPGECARAVRDVLREAGGWTPTNAIVAELMERKGFPDCDRTAARKVRGTVSTALHRCPEEFERREIDGWAYWRIVPIAAAGEAADLCQ